MLPMGGKVADFVFWAFIAFLITVFECIGR